MPGRGGDRRHERLGLRLALRPEGLGRRQRQKDEGLVIELGRFVEWNALRFDQCAIESIGAAVMPVQGVEPDAHGLGPVAFPAELRSGGEGEGLPRLHPAAPVLAAGCGVERQAFLIAPAVPVHTLLHHRGRAVSISQRRSAAASDFKAPILVSNHNLCRSRNPEGNAQAGIDGR